MRVCINPCSAFLAMPAEQPQTHVDHLVRGFEAEDFAWTVVESVFDGGELLMGDEAQIHALREELSDEAIGVLVGAALPGAVRVTEEGLPAICSGDQWHRRPLSRKCGSATFRHPRGGRSALAGLGALRTVRQGGVFTSVPSLRRAAPASVRRAALRACARPAR